MNFRKVYARLIADVRSVYLYYIKLSQPPLPPLKRPTQHRHLLGLYLSLYFCSSLLVCRDIVCRGCRVCRVEKERKGKCPLAFCCTLLTCIQTPLSLASVSARQKAVVNPMPSAIGRTGSKLRRGTTLSSEKRGPPHPFVQTNLT
jgi:hypothetical protein